MPERIIFRIVAVSLLLLIPIGIYFVPELMAAIVAGFFAVAPIWLPVGLTAIFVPLWILYARSQYVASIPYTVLELKPGEETPRTARAAELIFYSLYHRTDISRLMAILVGQVRLPWSFEIAATEGTVRFFIRVPTAHRAAVESRFRAEYRDIDIDEVRDYAREKSWNPFSMRLAMREYSLTKPDPFPLKTYEARESKDGTKDPLHDLLEALVAVGMREQLFISWIARPHQQERRHLWEEPTDPLQSDARTAIESLVGHSGNLKTIPESKQKVVVAIEAGLKKPSFDVGARALYVADHGDWDSARAEGLDTLLDSFGDQELNSFSAIDPEVRIAWPLSDIMKGVPGLMGGYLLNLYRRRAFFAPPYYGKPFVLNTAELATVWHLPHIGRASALGRARGARLEPPDNLPLAA
jgi:hypothetical protein